MIFFQCSANLSNPGEFWSFIKNTLLDVLPQFVPRVKLRSRGSVPRMTGALRHRLNRFRYSKRRLTLRVCSKSAQAVILSAEQSIILTKSPVL